MPDDERRAGGVSAGAVIVAFLSGAAMGALATLLLAPQSGRESREQLRGYARRGEEAVRDLADKATETWNQALEKGREFVEEQRSVLDEAFQAGREAMRRERERHESE
jgi:gas vesicle protein